MIMKSRAVFVYFLLEVQFHEWQKNVKLYCDLNLNLHSAGVLIVIVRLDWSYSKLHLKNSVATIEKLNDKSGRK